MRLRLTTLLALALMVSCDSPQSVTPRAQPPAPDPVPIAPEPPPLDAEQVSTLSQSLTRSVAAGQLRALVERRVLVGRLTVDGVRVGEGLALLGGGDAERSDYAPLDDGRFVLGVADGYEGGVVQLTVVEPFVGKLLAEVDADQARVEFELSADDIGVVEVEFVRPPETISQFPIGFHFGGGPPVLDERILPAARKSRCVGGGMSCIMHETTVNSNTTQFRAMRQSGVLLWAATRQLTRYPPTPPLGRSCAFTLDDGPRQTADVFIELPAGRPPVSKLVIELCPIPRPGQAAP